MVIRFLKASFVLAFLVFSTNVLAYVNPPSLSPPNPASGQTVNVTVEWGYCDALVDPQPDITRESNAIRIVIDSYHYTNIALCTYPPSATSTYAIGSFPAGSYTIQVDRRYQTFVGTEIVETLGTLPFTVRGQVEEVSIPSLGTFALALLFAGLLIISSRHKAALPAVALAFISLSSRAAEDDRSIWILLSANAGAPTAEEVVDHYRRSSPPGQPPLQAFSTVAPESVSFMVPGRATGDYLAYLEANPNTAEARLERYLVVRYSIVANIDNALAALQADPEVEYAAKALRMKFSSVNLAQFEVGQDESTETESATQYGRESLNIDAAWSLASGYAFVGVADSGLYTSHPALRQFSSTGQYLGGNFIPIASADFGFFPAVDLDVDEAAPIAPSPNLGGCALDSNGLAIPTYAGHGTHVSGLIAANPAAGYSVAGTCKHCGIAMMKITSHFCNQAPDITVYTALNIDAPPPAFKALANTGAQVINFSFGDSSVNEIFCQQYPTNPWCEALAVASYRDTILVASSGNDRVDLDFPANDARTISVGGYDSNVAFWDESPGSTTNCPLLPQTLECGSNYTNVVGGAKQESIASAKAVLSTTYPGKDWNFIGCGDTYPGPGFGNGKGLCTGTSMSAPQITGLVGILRSVNPLVKQGTPTVPVFGVPGVRAVLAQTTREAQASQAWSTKFGYGRPDAVAAVRRMLGRVAGAVVKNRVTPLFRLYSAGSKDYADTVSPQMAIALMINQESNYQPQGSTVPGYAAFPQDPNAAPLAAPRAAAYVLTTEYTPRASYPALVPLYAMERKRNWPLGCTSGAPGCNSTHRDLTLMTTVAHVESAHADGYALRTIQGYIYQPCTPEPSCIPTGAQKFYRACNTSIDDCASFLESERVTFEGAGYTSSYPSGSNKVIGYAYPSTDTDGDGLVDGFEYVVGTNPALADTNGDFINDGVQMPMAGVQVGDPCSGNAANCPGDVIFKNGFQ